MSACLWRGMDCRDAGRRPVYRIAVACLGALILAGCQFLSPPADAPQTVDYVDLERYAGTWYEIASYPNRFQEGCVATTATYTPREDGRIDVINRCRDGALDGPERVAEGVARVVDEESNARLKVSFFWPFSGDYWIIGLDEDYQWAVVGHPRRKYLWILARTPELQPQTRARIDELIKNRGYELEPLEQTLQPVVEMPPGIAHHD